MNETFENRDMAGTVFRNVNLHGAMFDDVDLREATIHNANLTGLTITGANISRLTIFGFRVDELIEAELDHRDPERSRLRMADPFDPECVRVVFHRLDQVRADFYTLLRATDRNILDMRPAPEQWSAIENLRHLVFAEDLYTNRWLLQNNEPWCPYGLLPAFLSDNPHYKGIGSQPNAGLETFLAAWASIHARVKQFIADATPEELHRDTSKIDFGQGTVSNVLQILALHDLEHIRQAEAAIRKLHRKE